MNPIKGSRRTLAGLRNADRKAVRVTEDALTTVEEIGPDPSLPLVIRASVKDVELTSWARTNRRWIDTALYERGALLFRNFSIPALGAFADFVQTVSGDPLEYRERSSPRTHVAGNIYTSTEYPSDQSIFLHNENSYAHVSPSKLFFFCSRPADRGGATPVADCRRVFQAIRPVIRERFIERRVLYVRNFDEGVGLTWQTVFGSSNRSEVEAWCRNAGYGVEWKKDGGLRTTRVGAAVRRHPATGELVWFNHATFFHISTLNAEVREALTAQFREEDLPNNTYYGDGSPIESSVMDELRAAYSQSKVTFPWQPLDILMVDNFLTAHGREPYTGARAVHVAMTEARSEGDPGTQS